MTLLWYGTNIITYICSWKYWVFQKSWAHLKSFIFKICPRLFEHPVLWIWHCNLQMAIYHLKCWRYSWRLWINKKSTEVTTVATFLNPILRIGDARTFAQRKRQSPYSKRSVETEWWKKRAKNKTLKCVYPLYGEMLSKPIQDRLLFHNNLLQEFSKCQHKQNNKESAAAATLVQQRPTSLLKPI